MKNQTNINSKIIDVKSYVKSLKFKVREQSIKLKNNHKVKPTLAVILVGKNSASEVYVAQKIKVCGYCHITSLKYQLAESTTEENLLKLINSLNQDKNINGILVQLPLPPQINETNIINSIDATKDVDGFNLENIGRLHSQQNQFVPCTPLGISMILEEKFGDLSGKTAVVIGRSRIVGRPMAELLLQKNCTVIQTHSRTPKNILNKLTQLADIIIVSVGIAHFLKEENIANGAVVIDVGINRIVNSEGESKLVGDVDFKNALKVVLAITPVPGGVGLLTVSFLMLNTLKATCLQYGIEFDASNY